MLLSNVEEQSTDTYVQYHHQKKHQKALHSVKEVRLKKIAGFDFFVQLAEKGESRGAEITSVLASGEHKYLGHSDFGVTTKEQARTLNMIKMCLLNFGSIMHALDKIYRPV